MLPLVTERFGPESHPGATHPQHWRTRQEPGDGFWRVEGVIEGRRIMAHNLSLSWLYISPKRTSRSIIVYLL
jgi:hypothetical protein